MPRLMINHAIITRTIISNGIRKQIVITRIIISNKETIRHPRNNSGHKQLRARATVLIIHSGLGPLYLLIIVDLGHSINYPLWTRLQAENGMNH